jgi:hypothetical protein
MHFFELLVLGWLLFGLLTVAGLSWMFKKAVEALDNNNAANSGTSPRQVANLANDNRVVRVEWRNRQLPVD